MKIKTVLMTSLFAAACLWLAGCQKPAEPAKTEASAPAAQTKEQIVVACSGTAVPYSYMDGKVHKGFEADMWQEIGKRSGYDIKMVTTGFAAIFGMLDSGQADVAGNYFGMSPERMKRYQASIPYATDTIYTAVQKDSKIQSMADLKGKKISVMEGTQAMELVQKDKGKYGFNVVVYGAEGTTAMQELNLGRVDAWIESILTIKLDSKKANMEFKIIDQPLSTTNIAYFVKKDDPAAAKKLAAINKAVESMLADGTVKKLSEKWFYTDVTKDIKK